MTGLLKDRLVIANAFSLSMIPQSPSVTLIIERLSLDEVREVVKRYEGKIYSIVGHESTAKILSRLLDTQIIYNRVFYKIKAGDAVLVCQLMTRLKEGEILSEKELEQLLEQNKIQFYIVIPLIIGFRRYHAFLA